MTFGGLRAARALLGLVGAVVLATAPARADPYLRWYTASTPHFQVHFPGGLEDVAQRTANIAETSRERLRTALGRAPSEVTQIVLSDSSDSANGFASVVPYDSIRLFVTAPEDLSPLGGYDDWMLGLVTHEQSHIFHLDNIGGAASILNAVLGKTYAPNQVQPHWILEGLAVAMETRFTSGGRLRSPLHDMYLRADVLEHHVARLDEMSHDVLRWPNGDIWYLYGSRFLAWISDVYGPDVLAFITADYGSNIFPWGINRSIRRATGRTYPELYAAWVRSLEERYGAQAAAVRAQGLRIGTRLTTGGRIAWNPRFVPACARSGPREELVYDRDDGHSPEGLYRLPLASRSQAAEGDLELLARVDGSPITASFDADCGMVFDSMAPTVRQYRFHDLHRLPRGETSATGRLGTRERLTTGIRARSPDVSPDGRHVVFVTNRGGTTTLRIASLLAEGGLDEGRALVPGVRDEQVFSPRFSPDGRRVAYSAWSRGGFRDVRVVDVETGLVTEITHDRAGDVTPAWTPDGRYLLFSSDRSGIANVVAYELSTKHTSQVTNVLTGAFMPEVSPDGKTLVYVGYTTSGYDLFSLPFEPPHFLSAPDYVDDRPPTLPDPPATRWPVTAYSALPTLRPRAYSLDYGTGTFGLALTVTAESSDAVGLHGLSGSFTYNSGISEFEGSVGYTYYPLPFRLRVTGFTDVSPRAAIDVGGRTVAVRDRSIGITSGLSYSLGGEFDGQTVAASYTAASHSPHYAIAELYDPYSDALSRPSDTFVGSTRVAWQYSATYRPLYGVSSERGFSLALSSDFAGPPTGSDATLAAFDGRASVFLRAPWLRHHVFALALSGGTATGSVAQRGYYFTGGFADSNTFDAVLSGVRQGAFVLRGYPPGAFIGRQYNLGNLEYRFPIAWVDHGVSTLPAFVQVLGGALFADYGGAFDRLDLGDPFGQYHLGLGGELRLSFTLGYFLDSNVRLGWAKGFGDQATPGSQVYFVAAATF